MERSPSEAKTELERWAADFARDYLPDLAEHKDRIAEVVVDRLWEVLIGRWGWVEVPAEGRCGQVGAAGSRQASLACRARRVRSARRRAPVLSRIRSRWVRTVRTLMNSSAAICASVRPWATKVTSSRSRALR